MEDYKEKYEKALERAKKYYNRELYAECNGSLVEDIFPELRESEDEKIRNGIIRCVKGNMPDNDFRKKYIDWLEKLGEQNIKMIQWKGDNLREVVEFTGKSPKFGEWFKTWDDYENYVHSHGNIFKLFCEDGSHYEVPEGAWIIKTPDGYNVASKATYVKKLSNNQSCFIIDKKTLDEVIELFKYLNYWVCGGNDTIINKLKHLKPQSFRKPSVEQKHTDKVEPKFKVGDTIRPKGSMAEYTIESISGECYKGKGWGLHISCDDDYEIVEKKPAWSEEDEGMCIFTIKILNDIHYKDNANWLKSLKERYTWKPTKEQIEAIRDAIEFLGCTKKVREDLKSLYEQLKKLREEQL